MIYYASELGNEPKKMWSGTSYALYSALKSYTSVQLVNLDSRRRNKIFNKVDNATNYFWRGASNADLGYKRIRRYQNYIRKQHWKSTDKLLSFAPVFSPYTQNYSFQDLNISYLKALSEKDKMAFLYSGFSKCTRYYLNKAEEWQSDYYKNGNAFFTMGKYLADFMVECQGIPEEKVYAVGGGINIDSDKINYNKKQRNKILFVGRDYRRKGLGPTIEAFRILLKDLPKAELYIVGPKSLPKDRIDLPNVKFFGDVNTDMVSTLMNLCDVFCMPSYFEAYGLVFGEALAYGLPCIGRNKFSMPEFIVHGQNGFLIKDDDVQKLSIYMKELLLDESYSKYVRNCKAEYIRKYSWESVAKRILSVLQD